MSGVYLHMSGATLMGREASPTCRGYPDMSGGYPDMSGGYLDGSGGDLDMSGKN